MGRTILYNIHHSVTRREKNFSLSTGYSDRCTVQAVNSNLAEIQCECQNAKKSRGDGCLPAKLGVNVGKKRSFIARMNDLCLLQRGIKKREKKIMKYK